MDQLVSTFLLIIPISVHSFLIFLCYQSHILPLIANMSCFFPLVFFVNVFLFHSIHALCPLFPPYFLPSYVSVFLYQGGCIHDGTWQSAVYGFADSDKLRSLRRKFNHKPLPTVGSRLKRRYVEYKCLFFSFLFFYISQILSSSVNQ